MSRIRVHAALATLVAMVLFGLFLFKQHTIQIQLLGEQQEIALDTAYRATLETTRRDIESRFRFQVMQADVLGLVARAQHASAQELPMLRGQLYRLLEPVYQEMQDIGLLQFQFHLADDRVLLRFHQPHRSGDTLFSLRPSIRIANTEQRSVHGLEIGRTASGFRYVFPLHQDNKHLGSVELSMPFNHLQTQMNRLLGSGEFALVFDQDRVFSTVDAANRVYYSASIIHPGFLVENPLLATAQQAFGQSDAAVRLQHQLRDNAKVQRLMSGHKSFAISAKDGDQHYMVSFLPVPDLTNKAVAYVIRFEPSNAPVHLFNTLVSSLFVAGLLILLLGILYFYNLRQRLQLQDDIRQRQETEAELSLYANIFKSSGEAIMVTNHENCITEINPSFSRLTGYTEKDVLGRSPSLLASGHTSTETYKTMWAALGEQDFWQGELWDRRKDGSVYPKWTTISAMRTQGVVSHYIASFTNISDRKAAEEKIERLAHHDALTGLLNRYSLELRLEQSLLIARREKLLTAVVFIDLDRFKTINDSLGHQVGDKLLIKVANRLKQRTRDSDIVSRQGGDEFVVVLTGLRQTNDVPHVINAMLLTLSQPYVIDQYSLNCTPSMGVSIFPVDGVDMETLLKNADTAMYHAKEQGRNNVQYFTAEMTQTASERLAIEQDLRHAIQNKEFELYYQPQVCARSRTIVASKH
ncbi:bifunctional diguanylate cyclase/phosphodiesterase [Nitrincola sp. A-D6]|uniref:bifunctional diguanylate cyclase/phosphodiesterase n=1 Tax=Nitrincola sp. A-D6 TaxID=1545442 RepID=UPI0013622AB4|nr:diguanylate cyclase [Nitrincola sp. A-D6]